MRAKYSIIFLIAILCLIGIAALSITGPTISPITDNKPSTEDVLTCSWTPSGDTTGQTVTWWNGTSRYSGPTSVAVGIDQRSLGSFIARKGENWTCEVILDNGTDTLATNVSVIIKNALPTPPNATDESFYEDHGRSFFIESTDSDNDNLYYYKLGSSPTYCSIVSSTGEVACSPQAADIGIANATYLVDDGGGKYYAKTNVTYTVIAVNDPPGFSVANQSILEGEQFYYDISVTDEENNFPISVSVSSNLSVVNATALDASTVRVFLNRPESRPSFLDKGTWSITLNVTDNGSSSDTPYDNPTASATFSLTISTINHAPNITTDLSALGLSGMQGGSLIFSVNASDMDEGDVLAFSTSTNCSLDNPWSINTTNSSENGTGEVNVALTNDHVLCRWLNISVSDGEESDWQVVFVNVTNTNDAPSIHELSHYPGNDGQNMSNLTAVTGESFTFRVNATDPDSATYEGEVLSFSDNGSGNVSVDSSGVLSFIPTAVDVGYHTLLVNVTDDGGLWSTRELRLLVNNNSAPILLPIGNISCAEDFTCSMLIEAVDPDSGEDLVFASNDTSVFAISDYNETAWKLNFTPLNAQVGSYAINVSVTDRYDFSDWEAFTFTINNTNDWPIFDQDHDGSADTLDFGIVVENHPTSYRVNVTDEDLAIGLDNLSYDWAFTVDPHGLNESFSISAAGDDYFVIAIDPSSAHIGSYAVNLSVTDNASATSWQVVAFDVLATTTDPSVDWVKPYTSGNVTVLGSFGDASAYPEHEVSIAIDENTTVVFDALMTNDSSIVDNALDYHWYVDGILEESSYDVVPGVDSSFSHEFGFFSAGSYNITLQAIDERYAEMNWSWLVDVADVNRDPVFLHTMPNITVNRSSEFSDFMSHTYNGSTWQQLFYDPDDDLDSDGRRGETTGEETSLTYSLAVGYGCSIASFSFSKDSLSVTPSAEGVCIVKFNATDPFGRSVSSNTVWVTVTAIEVEEVETSSGGGSSRPRTIPIPFEEPVETPHPIELIAPEEVVTYDNNTAEIPLTLHNTWEESAINGIWLNATTANSSYQPTFRFSTAYFPSLAVDEEVDVVLTVEGYRQDEPLAVIASATVTDPSYTDSATIIISSMEQRDSGDDVESKVTFARDLLNDNPECQELNELLERAEEERLKGNNDKAVQLVTKVVNGCKYLINAQEAVTPEHPKSFFSVMTISPKQLPALIIGGIIIAVLIVFGIVLLVTGRKKLDI